MCLIETIPGYELVFGLGAGFLAASCAVLLAVSDALASPLPFSQAAALDLSQAALFFAHAPSPACKANDTVIILRSITILFIVTIR